MLCRCTCLQTARIEVSFTHYFQFEGQGTTPALRRGHLQRQIALLGSSCDLLAPSSWPACGCLTALAVSSTPHLLAAMQTTSLRDLHVLALKDASTLANLRGISNLRSITSLTLSSSGHELPATALPAPFLSSAAALTNLSHLSVAVNAAGPSEHCWTDFPPTFTQLTALSSVTLGTVDVDLQQLTTLQAVRELQLEEAIVTAGNLSSLFPLTRLTNLTGPSQEYAQEYSPAGDVQEVHLPAAWRDGLVRLRWSCKDAYCVPTALATQLSSLVQLHLEDANVTQQLCRRCPLAPPLRRPSEGLPPTAYRLFWYRPDRRLPLPHVLYTCV
jgi:hypothetical protein